MTLRIAYCGNFGVSFSTESHIARAMRNNGHHVEPFRENEPGAFVRLSKRVRDFDLIVWTRTGWNPPVPHAEQFKMLVNAAEAGVPTVGVHLDRWWGLGREGQVRDEPFFRCALVATADGGHDAEWAAANVNHVWFPPGVSRDECEPGTFRRAMASDVAFVGSWRPGYHAEWRHRPQLVDFLRRTFRNRVAFWPKPGHPAIRGGDLRDLYASVKVLVGDSCLVGGVEKYHSDRIPESIGRGGFLLHPHVHGVTDGTLYVDGKHLRTWTLGRWGELRDLIEHYLSHDAERAEIAAAGKAHVMAEHTYERRMADLFVTLAERGLL